MAMVALMDYHLLLGCVKGGVCSTAYRHFPFKYLKKKKSVHSMHSSCDAVSKINETSF